MANAIRVMTRHPSSWTRFAIVFLAIAAACLGLVTMHSATSHSHGNGSASHDHSTSLHEETTVGTPPEMLASDSGLLANCDSCALGTATMATSALLALLLSWVAFLLLSSPSAYARLLERSRIIVSTASSGVRRLTPPPLALGISRT